MKNIILLIILLIVGAVFIYSQQSATEKSVEEKPAVVDSEPLVEAEPAAETLATASLISEATPDARVFIVSPTDGETVSSPIKVVFGLENMNVAPAGQNDPFSGHHHLLIDMETLPDMSLPLPATETLIHFGGGQTETEIELIPGEHTLQLLLGNYLHIPHDEPVISEKITITVE
ncbi:MAG: DUF4399 domain-containing protein [Pseudomonadota bacterium]